MIYAARDVMSTTAQKSSVDGHDGHLGTLGVLAVSVFVMAMLQSVVIPVLPALQEHLGTSTVGATWVLTSFLLSAAVCTPVVGRVGDLVGRKRVFVGCLVVLGISTAVAMVATSLPAMIVARVLQGVSGGLLPAAFGIVRDLVPPDRVAGAVGTISALIAVGFGAGIVIAGPIEAALGFTWLFGIPAVLVAAATVAAFYLVTPDDTVAVETGAPSNKINWPAAVCLATWLVLLLLSIGQAPTAGWVSARVLGLALFAVATAAVWLAIELRSTVPLIDVRVMRQTSVWTANLASFLLGVGAFASFSALPQFLQGSSMQDGFGFDASTSIAGLMIMPTSAAMFVLGLSTGRLTRRFGTRSLLVTGALIAAAAYIAIAIAHDTAPLMYLWCTIIGIGLGLAFAAVSNLVIAAVPPDQTGAVSGMNVNIRTVGGAVGAALMASLITVGGQPAGAPSETGYTLGFVMIASACGLAALICVSWTGKPKNHAR